MRPLRSHYIELYAIREEENRLRRYRITLDIRPEIETPYVVALLWGRVGGRLRSLSASFSEMSAALEYIKAVTKKRKKRGYTIYLVSKEHPLGDWVQELWPEENEITVEAPDQLALF